MANGEVKSFHCPACKSEIAVDGRALVKRSPYLLDVEECSHVLPKLQEELERLERELSEAKEKLKGGKTKNVVEPVSQGTETKPGSKPFWKRGKG